MVGKFLRRKFLRFCSESTLSHLEENILRTEVFRICPNRKNCRLQTSQNVSITVCSSDPDWQDSMCTHFASQLLSLTVPGPVDMLHNSRCEWATSLLDTLLFLRFSKIPTRKYPPGASPSDITRYSLDHSYVLQSMLQDVYHASGWGMHVEMGGALTRRWVGHVHSDGWGMCTQMGGACALRWEGHVHSDGWGMWTQMGEAHTHMCTHIQTGPHFL